MATLAIVALFIAGNVAVFAAAAPRRPNVLLIMTDDQGYGDLACHGNPILKTPNLDNLFAESIRFANFHVDPTCSPTQSALMTGRYSTHVGVWHTVMGRHIPRRDEAMMPAVFAARILAIANTDIDSVSSMATARWQILIFIRLPLSTDVY